MTPSENAHPIRAFGAALRDAGQSRDWARAEVILGVLDQRITGRIKSAAADEGEAFLEFATIAEVGQPELAERAISIFRRGWPTAGAGVNAEQRLRAARARREAQRDFSGLDHSSALTEYAAYKDAKDIPGRVRAHVAALRAYELMPSDVHALASLAAATRFVPDMADGDKRGLLADVVEKRQGRVGTGFLVSVAAMLIDMGGGHSARRILNEVDAIAPNNRHTTMVRARLASMKGDKIEAEYLGSTAFRGGRREQRSARTVERDPDFGAWLCNVLRRNEDRE